MRASLDGGRIDELTATTFSLFAPRVQSENDCFFLASLTSIVVCKEEICRMGKLAVAGNSS
jgi:hypothetical protein